MVTGSHIPADRNGIKFNRARGEFLKPDEAAMRELDVNLPEGWFDAEGTLSAPPDLPPVTDVVPGFVARYRDFFGADALAGLKLGIYQHSAVGRDVLVQIVEALGATAVPLGRMDSFIPVDTEAVRPEDAALAREWAADGALDAILTTDGDSDRPCWPTAMARGCAAMCWAFWPHGFWPPAPWQRRSAATRRWSRQVLPIRCSARASVRPMWSRP